MAFTLDLLHSVFLHKSLHHPFSMPWACSDTTLADLNLLLKFFCLGHLVVSGYAFSSHALGGKAESPTVVKGICPYPGNGNTWLGRQWPDSIDLNMSEDCRSVESWTEPGAPTPAHKKRLFAPMNPNSWNYRRCIHPRGPCKGTPSFQEKHLSRSSIPPRFLEVPRNRQIEPALCIL